MGRQEGWTDGGGDAERGRPDRSRPRRPCERERDTPPLLERDSPGTDRGRFGTLATRRTAGPRRTDRRLRRRRPPGARRDGAGLSGAAPPARPRVRPQGDLVGSPRPRRGRPVPARDEGGGADESPERRRRDRRG